MYMTSTSVFDMAEELIGPNDSNPFEGLLISEKWTKLRDLSERTVCQKCNKSRMYFCYTCYLPVPDIANDVPTLELPLELDIIKHSKEIDGKSTAIHAAVLCPRQVHIYTYPVIPNYCAEDKALLVFPGKNAVSVRELVAQASSDRDPGNPSFPFKKVILIDSTWNQCKGIFKDARIAGLPCVVLKKRVTQFWRHQNGVPRWHLSTIEAIHQFFVEFTEATREHDDTSDGLPTPYKGEYDDLLFFFRFMYDKINSLYGHDSLKSYKRPLT